MVYISFYVICFLASVVGAICGIGGGVIIKPVLDSFGILDVAVISFLSGCTVLSMTSYSVIKSRLGGQSRFEAKTGIPLSIGAALGGVVGKWIFSYISSLSSNPNRVGAVQAACLLVITVGTLFYTIWKDKVRSLKITNPCISAGIGGMLGIVSAFLGIGGGSINLVVLFFFFSMKTKDAAENSLYIIFFSQVASLLSSIFTRSVPDFEIGVLILMVIGGVTGAVLGRDINTKIEEEAVEKLFIWVMIMIIIVNVYNIYFFLS